MKLQFKALAGLVLLAMAWLCPTPTCCWAEDAAKEPDSAKPPAATSNAVKPDTEKVKTLAPATKPEAQAAKPEATAAKPAGKPAVNAAKKVLAADAKPQPATATIAIPAMRIMPAARAPIALQLQAGKAAQPGKAVSLLGAIVNAMGNDPTGNRKRAREAEEQNVKNLVGQFRPQYLQLLCVELAHLRRACKPDAKSFAELARASKGEIDEPLREFVLTHYMGRPGNPNALEPRQTVQNILKRLADSKLGPEKSHLYSEECERRRANQKHAVVLNLIASIDERLVLSAEQRDKLIEKLLANYEPTWDQYFEANVFGGQYVPPIKEESVLPLLNAKQKIVWDQTLKLSPRISFGGIIHNGMQGDGETQEIARIVDGAPDEK